QLGVLAALDSFRGVRLISLRLSGDRELNLFGATAPSLTIRACGIVWGSRLINGFGRCKGFGKMKIVIIILVRCNCWTAEFVFTIFLLSSCSLTFIRLLHLSPFLFCSDLMHLDAGS
ncbi:unnamed protein product, partial [Linum tenue]